jgi:hypothetical protein
MKPPNAWVAARVGEFDSAGIHARCLFGSSPPGRELSFLHATRSSQYGLQFIEPPSALAHPFDDGTAILLPRSVETTSRQLGRERKSYLKLMTPLVRNWPKLSSDILGPSRFPRHPFALARFGLHAIRSAESFAKSQFREPRTRAFFAGLAAHSSIALDQLATAAFGLVLGMLGHCAGWPIPRGGAQSIAAKCFLFDVTPRQFVENTGEDLPASFRSRLIKYRYGPGVFKAHRQRHPAAVFTACVATTPRDVRCERSNGRRIPHAKPQRRKENSMKETSVATRQRFASLRLCVSLLIFRTCHPILVCDSMRTKSVTQNAGGHLCECRANTAVRSVLFSRS